MSKYNHKKFFGSLTSFSFLFLFPVFMVFAEDPKSSLYTINNPLASNDVNGILVTIMNLVATVGAIVVVFFIIYSGYKFVTAGSSDTDRTKAKEMFFSTIIGGAILLGADVIANVVVNTVNATVGKK
jgi:hypothetical protein